VVPEGALLARLGGDEFAILIAAEGTTHSIAVAEAAESALADSLELDGMVVEVTVSIGIAMFPHHGEDLAGVLQRADIAMYRAKRTNRAIQVYAADLDDAETDRLRRVAELRHGLDVGEFVVHYQPKLDLRTRTITSVEALVRWQHPLRGLLPPGEFLGLVEEAGLMPLMTQVVLEKSLDQIAAWRPLGLDLSVAVNVSASTLMDAGLPVRASRMLASRDILPDRLQLEITEDVLMRDHDRARAVLTNLRMSGIRIAIDDFGTGYSSLSYLRDLPIDELKLDRSFIEPIKNDERAASLVRSIISLGHSLGLTVIAEGVEDASRLTQLASLGCDQAQGFHIARPMPGDQIPAWFDVQNLDSLAPKHGIAM
jgi:predicted signal transduction protein with EAL and GGDEF domain